MTSPDIRPSLSLLLAALIWGLAFVAQREGARYLEAFSFNGIRFALGAISLIPLLIWFRFRPVAIVPGGVIPFSRKGVLLSGILAGLVLFIAASCQQIGISDTTAGKAAFITGLYIPLVPVFGLFLRHRIGKGSWIGVGLAFVGLYLLSVTEAFTISRGDWWEMAGALFWTAHILLIDHFSKRVDALKLSFVQFVTCAFLSLLVAWAIESPTWEGIQMAGFPILFGGICSVGIAYTLQVVGQRKVKPAAAAIILSMETVFATIGGALILGETLSLRGAIGCGLMLTGIVVSQLLSRPKPDSAIPA